MNGLNGFSGELSRRLGERLPLADVVPDRSEHSLYRPPARPLVCVSLSKVQVKETALGDCYGVDTGRLRLGKGAVLTAALDIYCREDAGPGGCAGLFAALSEALLFDEELDLREVSCGSVEYLPKRELFHLEAQAKLSVLLVKGREEAPVNGFRLAVADGDADLNGKV